MTTTEGAKNGRPFWQQQPCPAWCGERHSEEHYREERYHYAAWTFHMQFAFGPLDRDCDPEGNYHYFPTEIELGVMQHVEWSAPVVELSIPGELRPCLELTPGEAKRIANALLSACAVMEGRTEDVTEGEWYPTKDRND